jgi:hypothetical protein
MLMMGSASAYIGWVPTVYDANSLPVVGNWNIAANWSPNTSDPDQTIRVPNTTDEVRFADSLIQCLIDSDTDAVCLQVKLGDNGVTGGHTLTIKGSLTTSTTNDWSAAGYNHAGTINVERGGSFINGYRIGIGLVASAAPAEPSVININGGEMTTGGNLQIGTDLGHKGIVNVNSGTLYVGGDLEFRDLNGATGGYWSLLNIRHGTLTVAGNEKAYADSLIANGSITGFGGLSTPTAVYANGVTTLTATDPLNHSPKMDAVVPVGDIELKWKNVGTSPVGVAVYFGTDPASLARITDPNTFIDQVKTGVTPDTKGDYIWRVDTYDDFTGPGDVNELSLIAGEPMYFYASDDLQPSVDMDTLPMATWINEPTPLQVTVKDDGKSAVTVTWTAKKGGVVDPNVVFTPPTNTIPAQPDYTGTGIAKATSMTCDYQAGLVTVTATVSDSNPLLLKDSADVNVFVASTACAASRAANGMNLAIVYPGDINADCMHDLEDFAALARDWQTDYTITEPEPDNR